MKVIAITERGEQFAVAVLKLHEIPLLGFQAEVRFIKGWEKLTDEQLLGAQTLYTWIRNKPFYANKSVRDCLENDQYTWSDSMDVQEV